jgi:hypothetical protein
MAKLYDVHQDDGQEEETLWTSDEKRDQYKLIACVIIDVHEYEPEIIIKGN